MGGLALGSMLPEMANASPSSTLAVKGAHFLPKAKRVIHIFLNGGPSHVDTFDPKPVLEKYAGKLLPMKNLRTERKTGAAFPSPYKFKRHGQSGIPVSEIFPHTAKCIDDIAVIRSMHADIPNHEPSLMLMNCGEARLIRPSVGSWVTYGLGSENQNLPGFITMCPGYPIQESQNWQSGFLPGIYQGTHINTRHTSVDKLIEHVKNRSLSLGEQRRQLDFIQQLNHEHAAKRQKDAQLEARIQSFELAYRMQMEAADVFDINREPKHIREMYGKGTQARQLLIARRLVERGVRFVELSCITKNIGAGGAANPWDQHNDLERGHTAMAWQVDQPIAALIQDLKRRGMLDETLVVWAGEFGRTPFSQGSDGRDHNPFGFSVFFAGGGCRAGSVYGATDELGYRAVEDVCDVYDMWATVLHLMGLDHESLTYRYGGRDVRLTDVHGDVIRGAIS